MANEAAMAGAMPGMLGMGSMGPAGTLPALLAATEVQLDLMRKAEAARQKGRE